MAALMSVRARTFAVLSDTRGSTQDVKINDTSGKAADVGLYTWGAAATLANELHHIKASLSANPSSAASDNAAIVLELGAGTGLVGIAAGLLWKARVVLTDLPEVVDNLAKNIELNASALAKAGGHATCGALNWEEPAKLTLHSNASSSSAASDMAVKPGQARVVFAADVLYSEELPPLLVDTVVVWAERSSETRVIFAYPLRVFMLDIIRDLWTRMEEAGFEAIEEGRAETSDEFDDEKLQEWCVWKWKE